ncbi:ATP-binding domain-containing protein, partial [bacterium]|nr:ATP-binding domain-containing protein [bacterium]
RHPKTLWSERKDGEKVEYSPCSSDRVEAETIGKIILSKVENENISFKDFAVFYRINAQSRILEESFQGLRIPNKIVGNISFFKRKEVKDLLAYIRLILNPYDSGACRRIINVPRRGIGKTTQKVLEGIADERKLDLLSAVDYAISENLLSSYKISHLKVFLDLINDLIRYERTHSAKEYVSKCLDATNYKSIYERDTSAEAQASMDIIQEFENSVADFSLRTDGDLAEYADYLSLHSEDEENGEERSDKVNLMTLHNAKGLEFPIVFVTGLEEGLCPLIRGEDQISKADMEEERRLLYVGMTRAKDKLYLFGADNRFLHGKLMQRTPSRFIPEIPEEFIELGSKELEKQKPKMEPFMVKRDYFVGERVRHSKWGSGTLFSCSGSGPKAKLVIRFDRYGNKKLVAGFANLVKIN